MCFIKITSLLRSALLPSRSHDTDAVRDFDYFEKESHNSPTSRDLIEGSQYIFLSPSVAIVETLVVFTFLPIVLAIILNFLHR